VSSATAQERAKRLIDQNANMVLATANVEGVPWISPVFYVMDDRYDLYWTSWVEARHSANVREHPPVAIVVYDEPPKDVEAVYISARAVELNDSDEVRYGIEIMRRRDDWQPEHWRIKDISVVTGDGPWRIYRASPETVEVRFAREERGERIVTREEADFRSSV
jgi:nitroimidazol reductase NimA-like FMN-containing flavoprotein (pyridoxamine 5'-phosphate oxidase superfamily)